MNKSRFIISACILFILFSACGSSQDALQRGVQTALAETQISTARTQVSIAQTQTRDAFLHPTNTQMPNNTFIPTSTFTPNLTNTPLPITKIECVSMGWLKLSANLESFGGKCIYLEGEVVGYSWPAQQTNRPADEGVMLIRPPEPNEKNLYLEVTLQGNQIFFNKLDSLINSEQGWIAIWGIFQDERNKYDPNKPRVAAEYPLEGYRLYASGYEALPPCSAGQTRTDQGVCAESTPTPDPLHSSKKDGFFLVGIDIAPGIWQSSGTGNSCYWEITTKTGYILNNHFGMSGGTMYIPATAFQVQLQNCGVWTYFGPAN
jgi:hypothetical protein